MDFFYCLEDFPNYQIFSNSKSFVKKHFPYGKIEKNVRYVLILERIKRIKILSRENNLLEISIFEV